MSDQDVARVVSITQCSPEQARFFLEAAGGDTGLAAQMYFDQMPAGYGGDGFPDRHPQLPPRPPAPHRAPPHRPPGGPNAPDSPVFNLVRATVGLPFTVMRIGFGLMASSVALGLAVAGFVGDRVLPRPVMRGVRGVAAAIAGRNDLEPQAQAVKFIREFKDAYGDRHPRWQSTDLHQACNMARTQHMFLMVYLHAPNHQDTDQFCKSVMCDPDLVDYCNQQFVCWGGDIHQSDAHTLAFRLGATTFPFVAVLSMAHSSSKATPVKAVQGTSLLVPGAMLQTLRRCVEDHGSVLIAARAELMERETTRQLLAEQNAEYEASLAADREREARRAEERRLREEEERRQAEAERKEREQREAQERLQQQRVDAIASRRAAKRQVLLPECESGVQGAAVVRVRLPDGSNAQRSFPPGSCVSALFDFVDSLDSTNYWKYHLVSNYPRKVFSQEPSSLQSSLQDAGLVPHGALFVQPLDEDEGSPA